jgi:hypothetical protein
LNGEEKRTLLHSVLSLNRPHVPNTVHRPRQHTSEEDGHTQSTAPWSWHTGVPLQVWREAHGWAMTFQIVCPGQNSCKTKCQNKALWEWRELRHNLSLKICSSLQYSVLACETNVFLGGEAALTAPARSNLLSCNEGWRKGLIKRPLITSLFLCVCPDGWQRKCASVDEKVISPLNLPGQVRIVKSNLILL